MSQLTADTHNLALSAITAAPTGIGTLSLHGLFETDGASAAESELLGGVPPYTRQPVTWNTPGGAAVTIAESVTFDIPAGSVVGWIGLWSTEDPPTFRGMSPIGGGIAPFVVSGSLGNTQTIQCVHAGAFAVDDTVVVWRSQLGFPTSTTGDLLEGQVYTVTVATDETIEISSEVTAPVSLTFNSDGAGYVQGFVVTTFVDQTVYELNVFQIELNLF